MVSSAKDGLAHMAVDLRGAVDDALLAVEDQLSLRLSRKCKNALDLAWKQYQMAHTHYVTKEKDEALGNEATVERRQRKKDFDAAVEGLEDYIESLETVPVEEAVADETSLLLAKDNVKVAQKESERKCKSLDSQIRKDLNSKQIVFLQEEIARAKEDLSSKLEEEFSSLLDVTKSAEKVRVNQDKAGALTRLNENLDKAIGDLLSKVPADRGAVMPDSVTSAVTASIEALGLGRRSTPPMYQAYAKETFPMFEGEMRKYPAWRKEMRELVLPGMEVVRQIRVMDKQTPAEVDLQTCTTVEEAWTELDTKYGNKVNISNGLMDDFVEHKLTSVSEESRVVELKQTVMKLYTDLKAVNCEGDLELNPFILNKVVARLPRFWQNKFSENKARLLKEAEDSACPLWTAISGFLKGEALRIETDMPSSLDANISKETQARKQVNTNTLRQDGQASQGGRQGRGGQGSANSDLKGEPCPECATIHEWTLRSTGEVLGSNWFTSCPKFKQGNCSEKAELLAKHGACARCTCYGHDKTKCRMTAYCGVGGCQLFHHPAVHGSKVAYVNALKVNLLEEQSRDIFLHVVPHKMAGEIYNMFLDDGSDCSLISARAARRLGLRGWKERSFMIRCGDLKPSEEVRTNYRVEVVDNLGKKIEIICIEVERITSEMKHRDVSEAYSLFPHIPAGALEAAVGEVDIMIGQDYSALLASGGEGLNVVDNLRAMRCKFGSGWVLGGWHEKLRGASAVIDHRANLLRGQRKVPNPHKINHVRCSPESVTKFLSDDLQEWKKGFPEPEELKQPVDEEEEERIRLTAIEQDRNELCIKADPSNVDEIPLDVLLKAKQRFDSKHYHDPNIDASQVLNPRKAKLLNPSKAAMDKVFPRNEVKQRSEVVKTIAEMHREAQAKKAEMKEEIMEELAKEIEELENEVGSSSSNSSDDEKTNKVTTEAPEVKQLPDAVPLEGKADKKEGEKSPEIGMKLDWGDSALAHLKEPEKTEAEKEEERKKEEELAKKLKEDAEKSKKLEDGEVDDGIEEGEVSSDEDRKKKKKRKRSRSKSRSRRSYSRRSRSRSRKRSRSRRRSYSRGRSPYDRKPSRRRSPSPYNRYGYSRKDLRDRSYSRERRDRRDRSQSRERRRQQEDERYERAKRAKEKLKRTWWDFWFAQCFEALFPFAKWKHAMPDLKGRDCRVQASRRSERVALYLCEAVAKETSSAKACSHTAHGIGGK